MSLLCLKANITTLTTIHVAITSYTTKNKRYSSSRTPSLLCQIISDNLMNFDFSWLDFIEKRDPFSLITHSNRPPCSCKTETKLQFKLRIYDGIWWSLSCLLAMLVSPFKSSTGIGCVTNMTYFFQIIGHMARGFTIQNPFLFYVRVYHNLF